MPSDDLKGQVQGQAQSHQKIILYDPTTFIQVVFPESAYFLRP